MKMWRNFAGRSARPLDGVPQTVDNANTQALFFRRPRMNQTP
jgi:hypothetical protein